VRPFGYLVKPLDDAKVAQVLDKIRRAQQQHNTGKPPLKRIEIKHKTMNRDEIVWCIKYINPDDILYIQTNNNGSTVKVQLVNGEMLDGVRLALNKWKAAYDLPDFMQIHRSQIERLLAAIDPESMLQSFGFEQRDTAEQSYESLAGLLG
jgi:DNA-binding LytR/AlgR family response regulator